MREYERERERGVHRVQFDRCKYSKESGLYKIASIPLASFPMIVLGGIVSLQKSLALLSRFGARFLTLINATAPVGAVLWFDSIAIYGRDTFCQR
jgi:hypothetical protein